MIAIRSKSEIEKLQRAADVVVAAHRVAIGLVEPGITTMELEKAILKVIESSGARPAFLGYRGTYPAASCISINEEIVHGIPSTERILNEGNIVGIDIGVEIDNYYGDCAYTIPVGRVCTKSAALLRRGKLCLDRSIRRALDGNRLGDICNEIQTVAEEAGYSVVRDFVGHGIGTKLHEEPQIPNYGPAGRGPRLKNGMVMALEPMLLTGSHKIEVLEDDWTVVTKDGGLSSHFEHTIVINDDEPIILTREWEEFVNPLLEAM